MIIMNKKVYLIAPGRLESTRALQWSYYLAKNLKKNGIKSVLIIPSDKGGNFLYDGIEVNSIKVNHKNRHLEEFIFSIKTIPKIIKNRKEIYFIHLNGFFTNFICTIIAKFLKIQCIVFCTDIVEEIYKSYNLPLPKIGSKIISFMNKVYAKLGNVIVTDSRAGKGWVIKEFGVKEDHILTTPHGFDSKLFYPRKKSKKLIKKYKLQGKKVLTFHGGDYGYHDGVDILFDSIKYLGKLRNKVKILLIGGFGGPGKEYGKLKKTKLSNAVFTGWVEDKMVPKCLALGDIYVLPWRSTREANITIPRKITEAMGMGLPILTSEIEAVKSEFRNMIDVVFFKTENPKDLAKKISILLKNKKLRRKLKKRSYNISKKFTWDSVTKKEINFLKNIGILK